MMAALPHRRLAGFYFFYFAWLGAFAPFFSIYLDAAGLSPVEIGVVMALPPVTRIIAPHLWGWLADASGRHDPCVGIRATPICEAMMALTLIDHALRHRAQNADVTCDTPRTPARAPADVIAKLRSAAAVENPDPDEA